ncbi:virulence RhuM family protein [Candidatus Dojkabacteria bacterium]|nr:virulence RhuM family protein [Candidatus Dojkabacteria bacterium]
MIKKAEKIEKLENFVIFQTDDGNVNIDVFFHNDNLWLTQKLMATLFEVERSVISKHLKNIFTEGELDEKSICAKFAHMKKRGRWYESTFYSLEAIIAVGYRVNSTRATSFRIWATDILKEFTIKGFVLDDDRLKQMKGFGKDYFDELLERIREIRASERRLYQKVTDIFALSADYDSKSTFTKEFFATVQNKFHWAITGKTAAEIIYTEADAKKVNMGLKTWGGKEKNRKILKRDVTVAKNYLNEEHLKALIRVVNTYLDLAEDRAERHIVMNMKDWSILLNDFLELANYPILTDKGKISQKQAKIKAEMEYEKFRPIQDKLYRSDFDLLLEETKRLTKDK